MPISSQFPYLFFSRSCKQIPILSGMCTCEFQSHHLLTAALLQDLACTAPGLHVPALWATTLDCSVPEAGAQGGTHPSMGPCLQEWTPSHVGSKSWWAQRLPSPASAPVCAGSRARGPEHPKCQKLRKRPCTKLLAPVPGAPVPGAHVPRE